MKKIGLIGLTAILVMGLLGVGYAMWSDTVTIGGPVQTGSLNLSFDWVEPPDVDEYYFNDQGQLVPGEADNKSVGVPDAWYEDYEERGSKKGYETLKIEVKNAYPGYVVRTKFLLHNIGTVPLNVTSYSFNGTKNELDGTWIYNLLYQAFDPGNPWDGALWEDLNKNGAVDNATDAEVINFRITNGLPFQIDPCTTNKQELDLHFKQPLQQGKLYEFEVTINAEQWAE